MQQSPLVSFAKCVNTRLTLAVQYVSQEQQRIIEEYLLCLGRRDTMLLVFPSVAIVPLEASDLRQVNHLCILWKYTTECKQRVYCQTLPITV